MFPDALVLKAVVPGSYAVEADFGDDRIGQEAEYLFGNLIAARCRAFEAEPRIPFDPHIAPATKDFLARLSRKLGRPISSGRAQQIRKRIHSRSPTATTIPRQGQKLGYRSMMVVDRLVSELKDFKVNSTASSPLVFLSPQSGGQGRIRASKLSSKARSRLTHRPTLR